MPLRQALLLPHLPHSLHSLHLLQARCEPYFTLPRLRRIATQCLDALRFVHGLDLIHCDLKPENILIKSYSRCEIKARPAQIGPD